MNENKKILELDKYEVGLIVNALNDFRNKLIKQDEDVDFVNEALLKVIEIPEKKNLLKCMKKNEERSI